jgi:hypothetical protein
MEIRDIKNDLNLLNSLDWDMTPEKAVCIYLEWGTCFSMNSSYQRWARDEESVYFIVNTWEKPAVIQMVKRNKNEAQDLATIQIPEDLKKEFLDSVGHRNGVFGLNKSLKNWLQGQLNWH